MDRNAVVLLTYLRVCWGSGHPNYRRKEIDWFDDLNYHLLVQSPLSPFALLPMILLPRKKEGEITYAVCLWLSAFSASSALAKSELRLLLLSCLLTWAGSTGLQLLLVVPLVLESFQVLLLRIRRFLRMSRNRI